MFEKEHQSTKKYLGMIIKAKSPEVWGNFYYVGDTKGKEAVLIVTLASKDPKGMKAASLGKKYRSTVSKGKFCQGLVRMKGAKLLFEVVGGTGNPKVMTAGFKGCLSQSAELKFLKTKAKVQTFQEQEEAAPEEIDSNATNSETEMAEDEDFLAFIEGVELSAQDIAEFESLSPRMNELEAQMASIYGATPPLSEAEIIAKEEERLQELIEQSLQETAEINQVCDSLRIQLESIEASGDPAEIQALREALAQRTEELQEARYNLASKLYTGEQPFPTPVSELPPEIKAVMSASLTDSVVALHKRLEEVKEETKTLHEEVLAHQSDSEWLKTEAIRILQQSAQKELAANGLLNEITQITTA